jgi:uncharacterized protein
MPVLSSIVVYPIKSLDGIAVTSVPVLPGGSLQYDREFAFFDTEEQYVHSKRHTRIHQVRTTFDLPQRRVTFTAAGLTATFHLDHQRSELTHWFSGFLGFPVTLRQDTHTGFPDDLKASGPTIVSTATLEIVASWYPNLGIEAIRQRFRANLELADAPAFWEDQLFSELEEDSLPFYLGVVKLLGINPCTRCIVPTRDAITGEAYRQFQRIFSEQRALTLPTWASKERFKHFYKLTTNTRIPLSEAGKLLCVGDNVTR